MHMVRQKREFRNFWINVLDEIFRDIINQPENVEGWIKLKKIN
jgi:hypothetical protein